MPAPLPEASVAQAPRRRVGGGGGPCGEAPGGPGASPAIVSFLRLDSPARGARTRPLLTGLGALGTPAPPRGPLVPVAARPPASPGYITLPLAVSWFQLRRLRPGTARGGAGELGPRQTPAGGPQRHRAPPDGTRRPRPTPRSHPRPLRGACRGSGRRRYVGWEVRAGGGEVEPRGPSPRGWSRTRVKAIKAGAGGEGPAPTFLSLSGSQNPEAISQEAQPAAPLHLWASRVCVRGGLR